jgi:hypothetical protein
MKRFLVVILSILYLASATGTTIHLHYCMGKLVSASLANTADAHNCSRCGMKKSPKNKCCKDESKKFSSNDQHQLSKVDFKPALKLAVLTPSYNIFADARPLSEQEAGSSSSAHAPPLIVRHHCPIYLEFRNIRI